MPEEIVALEMQPEQEQPNGHRVDRSNSLRSWLQEARRDAQSHKTIDLPIPRFKNRLWCTFRALDDALEVRAIQKQLRGQANGDLEELYMAADTLVSACVDTFALKDGEKVSLGVKLGLPLLAFLELQDESGEALPAENDRQATFAIFDSTTLLMVTADKYSEFLQGAGDEADGELEGNSQAPS